MTRRLGAPALSRKVTHKFGAVRTERAGVSFDSKAEADYQDVLQLAFRAQQLVGVTRQPVFYLPGGTRYVADFLCFWADERVDTRDVKGVETAEFKVKWRKVQVAYPFMTFVLVKCNGKGWKEEG